jgi:protein TonB
MARLGLLALAVLAHGAAVAYLATGGAQTLRKAMPEALTVSLLESSPQALPVATKPDSAKPVATAPPPPATQLQKLNTPPSKPSGANAAASSANSGPNSGANSAATPAPPGTTDLASPSTTPQAVSASPAATPAAPPAPAPASASSTASATAQPIPAAPVRQGVSIDAAYAASNPVPPYPAIARRLGEQGTVVLRILVSVDGRAEKVEIEKSSGSSTLDRSAETTLKQWRFIPAKIDGKPVEQWYVTRWTFKLEG